MIFMGISRLQSLCVGDVMSQNVVEIYQYQTMEEAARTFGKHRLTSAPVMNDQGRCVGILSASDFLQRDCPQGADPCGHELRQNNEDAPFQVEAPGDLVARYMTTGVQSVTASAPLLQAARIMCAEHIHHLPVMGNDRAIGVVSTMDIVAALINAVDEMEAST